MDKRNQIVNEPLLCRTQRRHRRSGVALLMALFVMTLASALVVATLDSQTLRYAALRNCVDWDRARYLAEAGIQHAFVFLEDDILWRKGIATTEFPIGSGQTYRVEVVDGADGTVTLTSVGNAGKFSRVLRATIKHGG